MATKSGAKKQQKFGRNGRWCAGYTLRGQRLKNKRKKLKRHIKHYPEDNQAIKALEKL